MKNPDLDALLEGPPFPRTALSAFAGALASRWPLLEEALLSTSRKPSFSRYLADFRGLALPPPPVGEQASVQEDVGEPVFVLLKEAFVAGLAGCAHEGVALRDAVRCYEALVNLQLFLWCGAGDRNFQFRTVVHFGALEGLGDDLVTVPEPVTLSFVEHGIRLSVGGVNDEHFPTRLPLSHVLVDAAFLERVSAPPDAAREAFLIARLRSFQRELCLLVDDWEHENALLAVEHTRIRQSLQTAPPARLEEALADILGRMGALRDALALWALQTFTVCQRAITLVMEAGAVGDLEAEVDATQAVLLAALQKIHLPASVSRHRYHADVLRQLATWCDERLRARPEDAATVVTRVAARIATGRQVDWGNIEGLLAARSYEWTLDYDPSSGLKACSWRLPRASHTVLSGVFLVLVARKLHPTPPSALWYSTAASLVQMPETFPGGGLPPESRGYPATPEAAGALAPPPSLVAVVRGEVLAILDRAASSVDAECVAYLRSSVPDSPGGAQA